MIVRLSGTLVEATPLRAVVDVGGVGYEVHVPVTTAERLPGWGRPVVLHTLAVYREDSATLYGFSGADERDFFRLMIEKVQNVGPRLALAILSSLSLPTLQAAIRAGDVALLAKAKGVGRKTAERLVIDLRDEVGNGALAGGADGSGAAPATGSAPASAGPLADAVLALTALGYKPADADQAVRRALAALGPAADTAALVRRALAGG